MSSWFRDNLLKLLPPLYEHNDATGDLKNFLKGPSQILDELKESIDQLPKLFDVDGCPERFLPLLSRMVGIEVDGTRPPEWERRRIREAVEIFRRRGTGPSVQRDFQLLGWQGQLNETFKQALRLNNRAALSHSKLPGQVFGFGAIEVVCHNQTAGLREALTFHQPAGTRSFWHQFLTQEIDGTIPAFEHSNGVRRIVMAFFGQTFALGRSALGQHRLTIKQSAWNSLQLTSTTEMLPRIEHSTIRISRLSGLQNRMRLNRRALNAWRLPYPRLTESCVSFSTPIYSGSNFQTDVLESGFVFGRARLNRKHLSYGLPELQYDFRQKDVFSQIAALMEGDAHSTALRVLEARPRAPQIGQGRLNKDLELSGSMFGRSAFHLRTTLVCTSTVSEALDQLDRWERPRSLLRLNIRPPNRKLGPAGVPGRRATLVVFHSTDIRHEPPPWGRAVVRLGQSPLNRTGFRWSGPSYGPINELSVFE